MRPAREIMGDLAATGMSPDQIALVMELSAAVSAEARPVADEAAVRRRERDKEYQAQKRNGRRQISADSDDVADKDPLSLPPNEKISNPPTHTPENNKPARVKGSRLPADWQPKTLTGDAGVAVRSWPAGSVDRELARFRDWAASATGPNALKTDWDAAWRNWIRKAEDDGRYGSRQSGRTAPGTPGSFLAHLAGQSP